MDRRKELTAGLLGPARRAEPVPEDVARRFEDRIAAKGEAIAGQRPAYNAVSRTVPAVYNVERLERLMKASRKVSRENLIGAGLASDRRPESMFGFVWDAELSGASQFSQLRDDFIEHRRRMRALVERWAEERPEAAAELRAALDAHDAELSALDAQEAP